MKQCTKCKTTKSISEFYKDNRSKSGTQSMCKDCFKEWQKSDTGKKVARKAHLSYKYKLTLEEYDEMLKKQNYSCAICATNVKECETGSGNHLAVDHCHTSGKIRGLLCNPCNILLGKAKDNITTLQSAINYLKQ